MKVHIRGIEVHVDSLEELDELIGRYGQDAPPQGNHEKKHKPNGGAGGTHDQLILEELVKAGETGVHTNKLGNWLGRRGKAVQAALMDWALKIGLINDKQINPFEKSRPDGGRGWRLSDSFLQVARKMVGETK